MPIAYPLQLRTVLSASKTRTQPAAFTVAQPRRGYGYVQEIGTDTPVFFDVAFRFTAAEALVFRQWFNFSINRGVDEFTMPIRTEYGLVDYTLRFMPDSLLPATQQGGTWGYTATLWARSEVVPAGYAEAAPIMVGLPTYPDWLDPIDRAINVSMPASFGVTFADGATWDLGVLWA